MVTEPLFSVVTPSFNQAQFIEHNLRSVLSQGYPSVEHLVVDGGSVDGTIALLKRYQGQYRLRWVSEHDSGQTDALVKGFRMSRGEYVGWLNADDMYFDKRALEWVANAFRAEPDVDVLYGDQVLVDAQNHIYCVNRLFEWDYRMILRGNALSQPATFFRRRVILSREPDKSLHHAMDLDYWLRLGRIYRFKHLQRVLAAFRIHDSAKSTAFRKDARAEARRVLAANGQLAPRRARTVRYLRDYPAAATRRLLALEDCITIPERIDELAFDPGPVTALNLTLNQFWPLRRPCPLLPYNKDPTRVPART